METKEQLRQRFRTVKDLKICGLCTLSYKKPVYHYSPSTPAKPISPDVTEIKGRVDKPHEETGGGFTIISMGKIGDEDTKCDSCGTSITKDELEVRGNLKLCTDCAVVYDVDKIKVEE